jgi:hypothetical protein
MPVEELPIETSGGSRRDIHAGHDDVMKAIAGK